MTFFPVLLSLSTLFPTHTLSLSFWHLPQSLLRLTITLLLLNPSFIHFLVNLHFRHLSHPMVRLLPDIRCETLHTVSKADFDINIPCMENQKKGLSCPFLPTFCNSLPWIQRISLAPTKITCCSMISSWILEKLEMIWKELKRNEPNGN